jgi:hypothetical protein
LIHIITGPLQETAIALEESDRDAKAIAAARMIDVMTQNAIRMR